VPNWHKLYYSSSKKYCAVCQWRCPYTHFRNYDCKLPIPSRLLFLWVQAALQFTTIMPNMGSLTLSKTAHIKQQLQTFTSSEKCHPSISSPHLCRLSRRHLQFFMKMPCTQIRDMHGCFQTSSFLSFCVKNKFIKKWKVHCSYCSRHKRCTMASFTCCPMLPL
jgi:hypothetical protein